LIKPKNNTNVAVKKSARELHGDIGSPQSLLT